MVGVSAPWPAPRPSGPLDAVVALPGSKSQTNRLLVLAALAPGRSVVRRPLRSRDTELMAEALRVLGVGVTDDADDWVVDGVGGPLAPTGDRVDVGNAGTVARFLPPVAALATDADAVYVAAITDTDAASVGDNVPPHAIWRIAKRGGAPKGSVAGASVDGFKCARH